MVLDDNCSIPDVCASMDVGPTALRRWVDQVRKERQKGQASSRYQGDQRRTARTPTTAGQDQAPGGRG
ncbi:hypothetical protein QIY50_18100 [Pseudomonas putida]|nr:hypothetical protein QIY50_18100 [Pseudomonas putida]